MEAPRIRFTVACLIAFVLWAVLLTRFVNLLLRPPPNAAAPPQATIEMRLVELAAPSVSTHAPSPVPSPAPAAVTPQVHARQVPTPARVAKPHEIQHSPPQHVTAKTDQQAPIAKPEASISTTSTAADTAAPSSSSISEAPPTGSAARIITQPMPSLPDDLREEAYQAIAVARFHIHTDGTIEVELSKPTQNPRLNALLLEALRQWRFFPAMQGGHPVESHQDVRVHFNVS